MKRDKDDVEIRDAFVDPFVCVDVLMISRALALRRNQQVENMVMRRGRRAWGAPKGLFDHILGNRGHLAKGLINEKGRSPSINSEIVM